MKNILKSIWLPVLILLLVVSWVVGYYNKFVSMGQGIDGQWAQVETQYQRRFDLIPNLVNTTKGYMEQEKEVFGKLAEARTRYSGAQTVDQKAEAATQVESALGRLLVVMENYPQLKSNETVRQLMDELAGTENRISVERRRFNDQVREYNTGVSMVPGKFIAGIFGFHTRQYFQSVTGAETAPKVEF